MPLFSNWKALVIYLLEDKNDFIRTEDVISIDGDSINLVFEKKIKNSTTKIEITTLESGELITLRYSNPIVPGYNEFSFGEYFYSLQFQTPPDYGKPGLEFNDINITGVKSILKEGVKGMEIQYVKNNNILKSEVHFQHDGYVHKFKYDFTNKSIWQRLFMQKVTNIEGVEVREIKLASIFPPLLVE